ncbi:MAG TPA: hypothetical protein VK935_20825, partial [Actinomycetospora sp.]|nr:hypothetical protein [Actinomycetospora sp.]
MEDDGAATLREPDGGEAALADPVAAGRLALARGAFAEARGLFEAAAREAAGAPALEGLSWAAWWLADDAAMFDLREQAYLAYRAEGDVRGAARMATWLGTDHVDFRGEAAVAQGWFGRARRLLEDLAPCEEHGWLLVHEAEKRLFANDTDTARDLGVRAAEIGRAERAVDLEMMGLATEGLALVTVGELDAGMSRLDQAVAAAIGGEFAEKWAMVWCCCYMLNACERVRDYDRAGQWCRRIEGLTAQARVRMLNLACRAYHGGVHIHRGAWTEAERTLVDAAAQLAAIRPPMVSEATVRLGELRRRQGRLDEAAAIFAGLEGHGLALLGSAEICLDRDDPARARDQAAQYLRDIPSHIGTLRAGGLELLVRAHLALGEPDTARTAADELAAIGDRVGTDSLRATARVAVGSVAAATGDAGLARVAFEDATRLFHRCEAPFEAGRARI